MWAGTCLGRAGCLCPFSELRVPAPPPGPPGERAPAPALEHPRGGLPGLRPLHPGRLPHRQLPAALHLPAPGPLGPHLERLGYGAPEAQRRASGSQGSPPGFLLGPSLSGPGRPGGRSRPGGQGRLPRVAPSSSARKARAQESLEGLRADGLLSRFLEKTQDPPIPTPRIPRPPASTVSPSTPHPPLWLTSSLSPGRL